MEIILKDDDRGRLHRVLTGLRELVDWSDEIPDESVRARGKMKVRASWFQDITSKAKFVGLIANRYGLTEGGH